MGLTNLADKLMENKRLIAIGDIHGHSGKLDNLLAQIEPTEDDQLVFLGDYVDRGPDSAGVLDRLIALQGELPQTIFLRGNHEQLFLDAMVIKGVRDDITLRDRSPFFSSDACGTDLMLFLGNGGADTMKSYGWDWNAIPKHHIEFIENTALWWRYDKFLFVHAGAMPGELESQDPWVMLWARDCGPGINGEIHVVGHTPLESGLPQFEPGRYLLDTGCAYGNSLTACDVITKQVWQGS